MSLELGSSAHHRGTVAARTARRRWPCRIWTVVLGATSLAQLLLLLSPGTLGGPLRAQSPPEAEYVASFDAVWSRATHPTSFPPGPHFSGLIGGTHNSEVRFWQVGDLASPGIKNMAELGAKEPLRSEVNAAIAAGTAGEVISGGGISLSPGSVSVSFTVTEDHPLVTLVSMIAPSPDWFVGVSGLDLRRDAGWVEGMVVELLPHDAGTDSGVVYTSPNQATVPPVPLSRITTSPFDGVTPLGTFTLTRVNPPLPPPVGEGEALRLQDDRFLIDVGWRTEDGPLSAGRGVQLTDDTGYFWFFNEENVEVVIKVLNGCDTNNRFWVFAGGLTNVEVEIRVQDTDTGRLRHYLNPRDVSFEPVQDTNAFATCP